MKGLGIFLALVGAACYLLPLLGVQILWLVQLGEGRMFLSIVLILIGTGLFFFSSYE
jgi:hypothetical protein